MKFDQSQTSDQPNDKAYTVFTIDSPDEDFIVNGDELVITPFDNGSSTSGYAKIKGVVMKNHKDANGMVSIWVELSNPASISTSKMYKSFISRSGKRNQLNASAGTISKLKTQ
jgi:hypothetical protein